VGREKPAHAGVDISGEVVGVPAHVRGRYAHASAGYSARVRAAVQARYGPPDVVRIREIDPPTPKDDEVLVRVRATTVNRTDCAVRAADPFVWRFISGFRGPKGGVLGTEFAGDVVTVGGRVSSFRIGDRVFGYTGLRLGAHAEYVSVPEGAAISIIPEGMTYEQAAPCMEGAHYARSHINKAKIRPGQDVLVYGATGAIGSAAVQILKARGVRATAVCAGSHVELVRQLGADKVVDYLMTDFTRDDQRYDMVFDAVGKSSFAACRRLLKPRGVYLSSGPGPYYQNLILPLVSPFLPGRRVLFAIPRDEPKTMRYIRNLIVAGSFRPVIDRSYPLEDIVEAYRYVETGQKIGNVVIVVAPPTS
jgi:NADPH:quinone reductase-like Zn-dependent oxidoreductase